VQWDEFYASKRAKWLRELDEGRELIRDAVSDRLRQINEHNYREIERTETLHEVINAVTSELKSELDRYRALAPEADFGNVARCVAATLRRQLKPDILRDVAKLIAEGGDT
jgi:hypothetical protein